MWRRAAGIAFVGAAFLFLTVFVVQNLSELRAQEWTVRPVLLVLSLLVNIIAAFWSVGVWKLLLRGAGYDVPLGGLARIWFVSALGRYIPGKIWQFVGAVQIGRTTGLPGAVTVTSLVANAFYFLVAAVLVSVYLLPAGLGIDSAILAVVQWIAPVILILVHPAPLAAAFRIIGRLTGRDLSEWKGSWGDAVRIVILAIIGWGLTGCALYLFLLSLTPLPWTAVPAVIGMNAVSFIVGNMVFIAPAGLGAKEGALAVMLAAYMTAPGAALVAIAARLWTVAAEILPALFLLRYRSGTDEHPASPASPPTESDASRNP